MTDLMEFLRARLDEDEWWAREASRDGKNPVPETGHHWQWVDGDTDEVIRPDPAASEYIEDSDGASARLSLRSVEEYPTQSGVGPLPQFAIHTAEEIPVPVGGHIARHDPARVLREIEAKRRIVALHSNPRGGDPSCSSLDYPENAEDCETLRLLTLPYADHPDYDESWRP